MQASHRTKSPISTLCKIANTTSKNGKTVPKPLHCFAVLAAVPFANPPRPKAVSSSKGTFIFWFVLCRSLRSVNGRACGSKELRRLFIGAIFQCPKPLWMLIFYDEAAQSHRTNQSFNIKNRALLFSSIEKFR
jgi:hypothetical protein